MSEVTYGIFSTSRHPRHELSKSYDSLVDDSLADRGKELHDKGVTSIKKSPVESKYIDNSLALASYGVAGIAAYSLRGKTISTRYGSVPASTVASVAAVALGSAVISGTVGRKRKELKHDRESLAAYNSRSNR